MVTVALAASAQLSQLSYNDNPAWGVLPSTNEVFFRDPGQNLAGQFNLPGQFPITVIAPSTGTYQVTIKGRAGSHEFNASNTSLCTQPRISLAGGTNSVKLCTSVDYEWEVGRLAGCKVFTFAKSVAGSSQTQEYALEAGVNTLYLRARELCTLTSELVVFQ